MSVSAVSLHQPWASLCVTRQTWREGAGWELFGRPAPMVKRFETRSWPIPPALIGQRIAIHATQRMPTKVEGNYWQGGDYAVRWSDNGGHFLLRQGGDRFPLPLGAIVGSCRVTASYPVLTVTDDSVEPDHFVEIDRDGASPKLLLWGPSGFSSDISDQLPYGDFTPGRFAWLIEDAAPTTERCPTCFNQFEGRMPGHYYGSNWDWVPCQTCKGAGCCDPIPTKGHQRIWNWQP